MFVVFVSAVVCWSIVPLQGQQGAALQFLTYCCKNNPPKTAAAAAAVLLCSLAAVWHLAPLSRSRFS